MRQEWNADDDGNDGRVMLDKHKRDNYISKWYKAISKAKQWT